MLGVRRDFYYADSDTNVRVNYFLNIDPTRKDYTQSKGKSNSCAKETFHNLILHSHFILHLQLIPFVSYYISLIYRATNEHTLVFCPEDFHDRCTA